MNKHYTKLIVMLMSMPFAAQFNSQAMTGRFARLFTARRMVAAGIPVVAGTAAIADQAVVGPVVYDKDGRSEWVVTLPEHFKPTQLVFDTKNLSVAVNKSDSGWQTTEIRNDWTSWWSRLKSWWYSPCYVVQKQGTKKALLPRGLHSSYETVVPLPLDQCSFSIYGNIQTNGLPGRENLVYRCVSKKEKEEIIGKVHSYDPENTTVTFDGVLNGKEHSIRVPMRQPVAS